MKGLLFLAFLAPLMTLGQITPIYNIQGSGTASSLDGTTVSTTGIVTGVFQGPGAIGAFFIQDMQGDGDPMTSDGLYIYANDPVTVGDSVVVDGEVDEYFGLTELTNVTAVSIISTGHTVVPTPVNLPFASDAEKEALEGMYLEFQQTLYVTDHYSLGQYGEIVLSSGDYLRITTDVVDPNDDPASGNSNSGSSNVANVMSYMEDNELNQILLDDAASGSNPNPIPYIDPTTKTLRTGSTVPNLVGCLSYGFGAYRLMPTMSPNIIYAPRPTVPNVGGNIKVASFNVLNFFTTIDNGTNGARGADSPSEYYRQKDKLVAALDSMDADIYALMEIENGSDDALDSLTAGINAVVGSGTYDYVQDIFSGSDAIKCAFLYNTNTVTPIDTMISSYNTVFLPPTTSQLFEVNGTNARFNVIANHFRFKGCSGASGLDQDQNDGQGCFNETRRQQAFELVNNFIPLVQSTTGEDDVLVVGDFNAYSQEDPIDILRGAGLTDLTPNTPSYLYFKEYGALDHAFANSTMNQQVTGADVWQINSMEPRTIDYNEESVTDDLYEPNAFRSSDHDPIIIGLNPVALSTAELTAQKDFKIYPNPASNQIRLEIDGVGAGRLQIIDLTGRVLLEQGFAPENPIIDVNGLHTGTYIIRLTDQNEVRTATFIKK